jgi:cobaltochelatase CobT
MSGVAQNLTAMLEDRYHRGNFDEITDRADAPLEDALAMLVRERLTGRSRRQAAKKVVDLWRDWIEKRADRDLDRLAEEIHDQRGFAEAMRDLLCDAEELTRLRAYLDKQLAATCRASWRGWPTSCSAA